MKGEIGGNCSVYFDVANVESLGFLLLVVRLHSFIGAWYVVIENKEAPPYIVVAHLLQWYHYMQRSAPGSR